MKSDPSCPGWPDGESAGRGLWARARPRGGKVNLRLDCIALASHHPFGGLGFLSPLNAEVGDGFMMRIK